jgi:urease accessory protein
VHRSTEIDLADGAVAVLRESLVLGRAGQDGGRLESRTRARIGGRPVLVESLVLDPAAQRDPAVLAGARCLDSVTSLGRRLPAGPGVLQLDRTGSVARRLVPQLHESGLASDFAAAVAGLSRPPRPVVV